ncbi:L-aspartate oxidase [Microcystis aeruginosa NIES-4325]|uniref:L-aspartate oxidase n=1 Tax=Microcystis aeruginosa NIES-4325 TaxID=2569534 RepID=A0A5J4FA01_MICAE|nr:L-aspartate oxidase [Microcystis aeruginosa]GEA27305.1 L-aspartate oxidase [Microcystis aeruginosa NIES-4325]
MVVSSQLPSYQDVLVVGSGAAGLYAALCLPANLKVGLITKEDLKTGASDWAQGGIAAATSPEDSPVFHLEDTLKAGAGLCDRYAVQFLVEKAPQAIADLLRLGVSFDRSGDDLARTLEAAHSQARVLHAADRTGRAIVSTLMEKVTERPNITIIPQAIALKLWLDPQGQRCQGICLLHQDHLCWLRAQAVILATGGGGQVYAQTTNPAVSTGDGVALAWRAGAVIRDPEFFQFHPTALTVPEAPRFLISEAVRGEGAHLIDAQGRRFAFDYHPAGELAPRDVVSRAIFSHLQKTSDDPAHAKVYLDLRPIEPERLRYRFPNIIRICQKWGINVLEDVIPVAPAAHYWMGGVATDLNARTSLPGLYAIGEVASTGVHGANRLASNSLLECIVFAASLAGIGLETKTLVGERPEKPLEIAEKWQEEQEYWQKVRRELPILMWENAGICRFQNELETAILCVQQWKQQLHSLKMGQFLQNLLPDKGQLFLCPSMQLEIRIAIETLNLLDIADLILESALLRAESRGGHYRGDYPETLANWQVHTTIHGRTWRRTPVQA